MRIGIDAALLEVQRGGVARIVTTMLRLWPEMTNRHRVVLYFEQVVPPDDFLHREMFEHRVVPRPAGLGGTSLLRHHWALPRQAREDRVDLFFSPWYHGPIVNFTPKSIVGIWDISFTTHRHQYPLKEGLRLSLLSRWSARHSSGVVTCSEYDKQQIVKYYGIDADRVCALPLAPDPKFSAPRDPARIEAVRRKYGLPERYILSLGVISNRRQVDVITDGFSGMMAEFPDVGLMVVGRDHTVPRVGIAEHIQPVVEQGRACYLEFAPEDDLIHLYHGAWYYICVSTVDGEATMLKEAMRCRTPVITSPLLEDAVGGRALIVQDPTDRRQMADVFRRAMDPGARERLAADGLEWARTLSWERVARMSLDFFESR